MRRGLSIVLGACWLTSVQAQPTQLQFDAVSIRPAQPSLKQLKSAKDVEAFEALRPKITPGFISLPHESLASLITRAFGVSYEAVATPQWSRESIWSVTATIPKGATEKDIPEMLQNMLASRFGLTYHRETRATQALALTIDKGGLKAPRASQQAPLGTTYAEDSRRTGGMHHVLAGTSTELARFLEKDCDMEVVDRTGLSGAGFYTFIWDFYQFGGLDSQYNHLNPNPAPSYPLSVAVWHDEGLQKIGLRLNPTTVDRPNIVIDKLNRTPTEN